MKLPSLKRRILEFSAGKTSKEKKYSTITESLIRESKGIVTGTDLSTHFSGKDEYVVPHKAGGEKLNWQLYSKVYNTVGIVKNAINNTANFAIQSGYELDGPENDVSKVKDWIDEHNFDLIMLNVLKLMLIYGNAYLEMPTPDTLKLLPVDQMYVVVYKGGGRDGEIKGYKQLTDMNITNPPTWTPDEIIHFKWNELGTSFYGIPDIRPSLTSVRYMLQYLEDIGEIIHRYGHPIIHWVVGTEDSPGTQTQIDALISKLNDVKVGQDLVTAFGVEGKVMAADLRVLQPDGLLKTVENQVIGSLEVPDFFVRGGETSNRATSQTMLQAFDRRVKALRQTMGQIIEDRIFKEKLGAKVKFAWRELSTEGEETKSNIVRNLSGTQGAGVPPTTALKMVGWGSWVDEYEKDFDTELERQAKLKKATTPPKPPKEIPPPPKEDDFEDQSEWVESLAKWKRKYLKGYRE